jgi:YidC/Oxa1 family membrane protein insertase
MTNPFELFQFTQWFSILLVEIYKVTGDLGISIILFTILIRTALVPITLPSLKSFQKMRELQPELSKLKKQHKDKQAFAAAQMELYKKYNINPLSGCLPQLVQMVLLYVLYLALTQFLNSPEFAGVAINPHFLWMNLSKTDPFYIIPVLAAGSQLILSLMLAPATETPDVVPNTSKVKKLQKANEKEEDMAEMSQTIQQQMIFMLPVIIGISAAQFPAGLGVYWVVTTIFSLVQQYFISGWGGLLTYPQRGLVLAREFKLSSYFGERKE